MQGQVTELIRELMQTQRMSVRKISAQIAREHGGSDLGYTQQINRILNDPDYDPNFSTVQKVLAALNCSLWQAAPKLELERMTDRIDRLSQDISALKATVDHLHASVEVLATHLGTPGSVPAPPRSQVLPIDGEKEA